MSESCCHCKWICCAQGCSVLADDTDTRPRLLLFPSPVSLPSLCSSPSTCHASLLPPDFPGTKQRPLSHQYHDWSGIFLCPKSWIRVHIGKKKPACRCYQASEREQHQPEHRNTYSTCTVLWFAVTGNIFFFSSFWLFSQLASLIWLVT